jgi:hypothetical protein
MVVEILVLSGMDFVSSHFMTCPLPLHTLQLDIFFPVPLQSGQTISNPLPARIVRFPLQVPQLRSGEREVP